MGKDKFNDSFFDRDDLNDMTDEELLDKLKENRQAAERWDEENSDPRR